VENPFLTNQSKRWCYGLWLLLIGIYAMVHALHLSADFPNHTRWFSDWAKYTDEGWYGNAAVRSHLFGSWYLKGDFNPAVALPVWPFLEWMLFFITGVTLQAARGLAVSFFFVNLLLSYLLLKSRGPRWVGLLAVTLLVTSPFLYCFSRLAILEPMLTALTLAAMNLAVRLPRLRRPMVASVGIGLLFTLMMLTKTTAVFLLPALGWALLLPLWHRRKLALRCGVAALGAAAISFGAWITVVARLGLLGDYSYLFFINKYPKPTEFYWPLLSAKWSFNGGLWVDHILIPLAGLVVAGAALAWQRTWGRRLLLDPVFGASVWAVAGYLLFMTYQNHPQPRYYAVVALFCFILVAQGAEALAGYLAAVEKPARHRHKARIAGWAVVGLGVAAVGINCAQTMRYVLHPQYTFINAARGLTRYIDAHPNGKRLLVSISGDQITMATHLPTLCDDFGTEELHSKLADYDPGWYAAWNDLDPGTLEDIHTHFRLEQVASFSAFDDPERDQLVLFKLHRLPSGRVRDPGEQELKVVLDDDRVVIPVE